MKASSKTRGSSLIDVLVGIAVLLIVFLGIFGVFKLSIELVSSSKAKTGAVALANEQIEFLRSLSYDDVGTVGGIPAGNIPQEETIVLNQSTYTRRTFIQYVDDPKDGLGAADENSVTADYKVAKVELKWNIGETERKFLLVSNIVPKGIETLAGGGILTINTIDALGAPLPGAQVTIKNNSTNPTIDLTTFTSGSGKVTLPGTPAESNYEINVTKEGYSTAKTYDADAGNPNPDPGHLTVIDGETTSSSFAIDLLSSKIVQTWEPIKENEFEDLFPNDLNLSATTSTEVIGGGIRLFEDPGFGYSATGSAFSIKIGPQYLAGWKSIFFSDNKPADTDILYKVYFVNSASTTIIVPDVDLAGNSVGATTSPIDISGLSIVSYPNIKIAGFLSTTDASSTPEILDWKIVYDEGPTPLGYIPFHMRGNKTIGSDGGGAPIYKYSASHQTNPTGELSLNNLEWDNYTITIDDAVTGYDISESCLPQPRSISPNVSTTTDIYLVPDTAHSIIVSVTDDAGALLPDASVRLYRLPYDQTQSTSVCGQTFFSGLLEGTVSGGDPYAIGVTLSGFENETVTDVDISGASKITIPLNTL